MSDNPWKEGIKIYKIEQRGTDFVPPKGLPIEQNDHQNEKHRCGKNAESAPDIEVPQTELASAGVLSEQSRRNEVARNDEKNPHPEVGVLTKKSWCMSRTGSVA